MLVPKLDTDVETRLWFEAFDLVLSWSRYDVTDPGNFGEETGSGTGEMSFDEKNTSFTLYNDNP